MKVLVKRFSVFTLFTISIGISGFVNAASDAIEIERIFATTDGRFAIRAKNLPPNINAEQSCSSESWTQYWYGFRVDDNSRSVVSAILSAQARNESVQVVATGCEGNWHKILHVYVH